MGNTSPTPIRRQSSTHHNVCPSHHDAACQYASQVRQSLTKLDLVSFIHQHTHLQVSIDAYAKRKDDEDDFVNAATLLAKFAGDSFDDDTSQYRARELVLKPGTTTLSILQWFKDYKEIELAFNVRVRHPYVHFTRDDGSKTLMVSTIDMLLLRHDPHPHMVYVSVLDSDETDTDGMRKSVTTKLHAIRLALQAYLLTRVVQEFGHKDFTDSFRAAYAQEPRFVTIVANLKENIALYVEYERTLEHYLREISSNITTCSPDAPRPMEPKGLPSLDEAKKLFGHAS